MNSPKLNTLILNGLKQAKNPTDALSLIQKGSTIKEYNLISTFFQWCKKQSQEIKNYNIRHLWFKFEKEYNKLKGF